MNLGYKYQTAVDFSPICITQMEEKFKGITWLCADVRNMHIFENGSFDNLIDKGTLDAMLGGGSLWPGQVEEAVADRVGSYVSETARVLKQGGIWLYVTYRQPHFIKPLLEIGNHWSDIKVETISGTPGTGMFEYFGYILKKPENST
jgi:hypothetical protein